MTSPVITPSGAPVASGPASGTDAELSIRYHGRSQGQFVSYQVKIAAPAPKSIRVSLELGREEDGVWAHIPELDVSAEGANVEEAFRNVYSVARDWLAYIREESPDLGPDVADQARYVALIDAPVFSWFKDFRFAD
jgi:hypothetical protein